MLAGLSVAQIAVLYNVVRKLVANLVNQLKACLVCVVQGEEQAQQPQRRDRIPLHHFLRLIGGGRVIVRCDACNVVTLWQSLGLGLVTVTIQTIHVSIMRCLSSCHRKGTSLQIMMSWSPISSEVGSSSSKSNIHTSNRSSPCTHLFSTACISAEELQGCCNDSNTQVTCQC